MTKKEFECFFKEEMMPLIFIHENRWQTEWEHPDKPLRREQWNDTIDMYIKESLIPKRAGDWVHPRWLETMKPSRHFWRLFHARIHVYNGDQ
jgi:hypothetical protein